MNILKFFFFTLISSFNLVWASSNDGSGLQTSLAVNILAKSDEKSVEINEVELLFRAPADHIYDAAASIAAHNKGSFEIHEAFIGTHKLIPRLNVKVGQFFLGIGRLNQVHRHDWSFVTAPTFFKEYFGSEGVLDSGLETSYLLPFSFYLDCTAGLVSGWTFGHSHNKGTQPILPTHYFRLKTFIDYDDAFGMVLGLNYLGRKSHDKEYLHLLGIDAVAKGDLFGKQYSIEFENWYRFKTFETAESEISTGFYFYPQYEFVKNFKAGLLLDYYTVLSHKNISGEKINNYELLLSPNLTYNSSEFALFRLAYDYSQIALDGSPNENKHTVKFQIVFTLGAHPAHDF